MSFFCATLVSMFEYQPTELQYLSKLNLFERNTGELLIVNCQLLIQLYQHCHHKRKMNKTMMMKQII